MGMIYRRKKKLPDGKRVATGPYWIKYYRNGKPYRESSESEKESDARRLLKQKEGDIAKGLPITPKVGRVTIDELLEGVIDDYQVNGKKSTEILKRKVELHLRPYFGGRRAANITTADVQKYVAYRQQEQAANASINRELAALKRAYSLAL